MFWAWIFTNRINELIDKSFYITYNNLKILSKHAFVTNRKWKWNIFKFTYLTIFSIIQKTVIFQIYIINDTFKSPYNGNITDECTSILGLKEKLKVKGCK